MKIILRRVNITGEHTETHKYDTMQMKICLEHSKIQNISILQEVPAQ